MTESQFAMISDWMENGNINEFVKTNPEADKLGLVCLLFKFHHLPLTFLDHQITSPAGRSRPGIDVHS